MDTAPVVACGRLFVATVSDGLLVLDPRDGSEITRAPFDGRPGGIVVTGGLIVIATYLGELQAFGGSIGPDGSLAP